MVKEHIAQASDVRRAVNAVFVASGDNGASRANGVDVTEIDGPAARSDLAKARTLVMRFGWNATAYQILNPGIELWFDPAREGVIGFVRDGRTRVVGGAPVCELSQLDALVSGFVRDAAGHGEHVCFFGAGDRLDTLALGLGWSRVLLGAQPIWDPNNWPNAIERRRSLRAQFNRARNKGVSISEWASDRAENHEALRRCLNEWLETRNLPPLHFLVEPETLSNLRDRRVFVAERDGGVVGFTILSPVPARNGWLVEQIIRGANAPNGTAELLIDSAMRSVASSGATYATLGLSALSDRAAGTPIQQPLWLRVVLKWVKLHGARFYNFGGLDAFKAKFNPDSWEPIYAIAAAKNFTPRDLYAIAGAFSGGAPIRLVLRALFKAARQEVRLQLNRLVFRQ
jgi:phosphatidylglycerol lysyltransferase